MRDDSTVQKVLKRLEWIAKISNETYPGGLPIDETGLRKLLNHMVVDVRAACSMLTQDTARSSSDLSDRSDRSGWTDEKREKPGLIPTHGGYRNLRSFQTTEIVYDATVIFCDRVCVQALAYA